MGLTVRLRRVFSTDDSIVAIATPPGRGGIGVVRMSGRSLVDIAAAILDRRSRFARGAPRTRAFAAARRLAASSTKSS